MQNFPPVLYDLLKSPHLAAGETLKTPHQFASLHLYSLALRFHGHFMTFLCILNNRVCRQLSQPQFSVRLVLTSAAHLLFVANCPTLLLTYSCVPSHMLSFQPDDCTYRTDFLYYKVHNRCLRSFSPVSSGDSVALFLCLFNAVTMTGFLVA